VGDGITAEAVTTALNRRPEALAYIQRLSVGIREPPPDGDAGEDEWTERELYGERHWAAFGRRLAAARPVSLTLDTSLSSAMTDLACALTTTSRLHVLDPSDTDLARMLAAMTGLRGLSIVVTGGHWPAPRPSSTMRLAGALESLGLEIGSASACGRNGAIWRLLGGPVGSLRKLWLQLGGEKVEPLATALVERAHVGSPLLRELSLSLAPFTESGAAITFDSGLAAAVSAFAGLEKLHLNGVVVTPGARLDVECKPVVSFVRIASPLLEDYVPVVEAFPGCPQVKIHIFQYGPLRGLLRRHCKDRGLTHIRIPDFHQPGVPGRRRRKKKRGQARASAAGPDAQAAQTV